MKGGKHMLTTTTERTVLVCSWADPVNNPPELLGKPDFTGCEVPVSEVPASRARCMYCGGGR
jgi:hypothetical protein